jgi:hypothetical protein
VTQERRPFLTKLALAFADTLAYNVHIHCTPRMGNKLTRPGSKKLASATKHVSGDPRLQTTGRQMQSSTRARLKATRGSPGILRRKKGFGGPRCKVGHLQDGGREAVQGVLERDEGVDEALSEEVRLGVLHAQEIAHRVGQLLDLVAHVGVCKVIAGRCE